MVCCDCRFPAIFRCPSSNSSWRGFVQFCRCYNASEMKLMAKESEWSRTGNYDTGRPRRRGAVVDPRCRGWPALRWGAMVQAVQRSEPIAWSKRGQTLGFLPYTTVEGHDAPCNFALNLHGILVFRRGSQGDRQRVVYCTRKPSLHCTAP